MKKKAGGSEPAKLGMDGGIGSLEFTSLLHTTTGTDLYSGLSLSAVVMLYEAATNTKLTSAKPLILGEIWGRFL